MIDWDWLAEIAVPAGNGESCISTGVPLSNKYVLTTAHGVPADPKHEVGVRFIDDYQNNHDWRSAHTVWYNTDLDAALIEFTKEEGLHSFIYSSFLPCEITRWEGSGFPAAGKINFGTLEGHRDTVYLYGNYYPGGSLKRRDLELTVEAPPDILGKWKGISGAPIMIGDRLIGIVKTLNENFHGDRLNGVPIWKLLEDDDFRRILGVSGRKELLDAVIFKVRGILKSDEKLLSLLCNQHELANCKKDADAVVAALLGMEIAAFIETLYAAHGRVEDDATGAAVERLLSLLLPFLYDPDCIDSVRLGIEQGVIHSLPIATRTFAEVIMAGTDLRPAGFRKPISGDSFPVGAPLIELPPAVGFDLAGEEAKINAFDEHMYGKFMSEEDRGRSLEDHDKRDLVNDELEYISKKVQDQSYRHYFIYQVPPENQSVRERVLHNIGLLKKAYPQMIFISLSSSVESLKAERKLCRPLRDFFRSRKGGTTP